MPLHIYKDADETCNALAEWIAGLIKKTLSQKNNFNIALSGGETPQKLYQKLASSYTEKIDWAKINVFWGDERFVPITDENNNAKMAFDNLISKINIPADQIHPIQTNMDAEKSAQQYQKLLHQHFDKMATTFDLALLGMGDDGHTLSLFPGNEVLLKKNAWVSVVHSKEKGERLTLMPDVVNRSSAVVFLVTGKKKANVLKEVIENPGSEKFPAQLIQPSNDELHWFLDDEVAYLL